VIVPFTLPIVATSTLAGPATSESLSGPIVNLPDGAPMSRKLRSLLDRWQLKEDLFAKCPWSNLILWVYTLCWLIAEKGIIGWDGWATVVAIDLTLSIRRHQRKN